MGRSLLVYADGGSRGNPGVAGYGAVVLDAGSGDLLAERAEPLGQASNNVAEYSGLIAGLRAAIEIDPGADIEARLDSKLVVEQMAGRWKIKHEDMRRLALEARDLARSVVAAGGSVTYEWVPRSENAQADALSNVAMDGETVTSDYWRNESRAPDEDNPDGAPSSLRRNRSEVMTPPDQETPAVARAMGTGAGAQPGRGAVTRLVLVRHGVTEFTEQGRLDGRGGYDPSLSERGREQAQRAAESVRSLLAGTDARVITSSLARAVETGAVIAEALGVEPRIDADFDEQNFGDWDGVAVGDLVGTDLEELLRFRHDPEYARPGGENHHDLMDRVSGAYRRVVAGGGTAVVVCHRKPIMCILADILELSVEASWRLAAAPGSLTAIETWEDGTTSIAFTNRT